MPRGRSELKAYLQKCLERVERVPDDEPWSQIRFPRQDAKKQITARKSKKAMICSDEEGIADFRKHKERIMRMPQIGENPVRFGQFVTDLLATIDENFVWRWGRAHEGVEEGSDSDQAS